MQNKGREGIVFCLFFFGIDGAEGVESLPVSCFKFLRVSSSVSRFSPGAKVSHIKLLSFAQRQVQRNGSHPLNTRSKWYSNLIPHKGSGGQILLSSQSSMY
jgi:hypothetical protein